MRRKNIVASMLLIAAIALSGFLVIAEDDTSTGIRSYTIEIGPGMYNVYFEWTSADNKPPEFIYFVVWGGGQKLYLPAMANEVEANWDTYKDMFKEVDTGDDDYTDGKLYVYANVLHYDTYGIKSMHTLASDGTILYRYPSEEGVEQVFGYVKMSSGPTEYVPTPYPYPYPAAD